MKINTIKEINHMETKYIFGGINLLGVDAPKLIKGALVSGALKTTAYYIETLMPKGKKDTFNGEIWNGIIKGVSCSLSIISTSVLGAYIVLATRNHPA